jgi:lipopolysaccharide biosynthesis glycosyltransferase
MKWFFAVSEVSMDHHDHDFRALIRSAVNSARANTQLVPHMIFDGEEGAFTREIRDLGVTVIRHRISFYDRLEAAQRAQRPDWTSYMFVASGALLRLEIPLLEQSDDFVLYTDCDVIFLKDPVLDHVRPGVFAVAPERQRGSHEDMNSGVMVMNLPRLRADLPTLVTFLCENFTTVNGFDQEAYRHFYKGAWSALTPDHNWKPYWGVNPEAVIVHFHGPKPPAIRKLMADPDYGAPDVWRQLYFQNPESYAPYFHLWETFQAPVKSEQLSA